MQSGYFQCLHPRKPNQQRLTRAFIHQLPAKSLNRSASASWRCSSLISAGLTNQEIAAQLVIALSTVKSHINSLYGKLGIHRRAQAVVIARELDLLSD